MFFSTQVVILGKHSRGYHYMLANLVRTFLHGKYSYILEGKIFCSGCGNFNQEAEMHG